MNIQKSSQAGITMIELMVASFLSVLVVGLTLPIVLMEHTLFVKDSDRAVLETGSGGGMDLMGVKIRQAGERMGTAVPAIELINGSGTDPDELKIRRGILEEHLVVCREAKTTQSYVSIYRKNKSNQGCRNDVGLTEWSNYVTAQGSGNVTAFIYDSDDDKQEFFTINTVYNQVAAPASNEEWRMSRTSGNWASQYNRWESYLYIMDEWHFYVDSNYLKVKVNNGAEEKVIHGVTDMQIDLTLFDSSTITSYNYSNTATNPWTDIHFVNISLTTEYTGESGQVQTKVLTNSFFPRNGMSEVNSS